MDDGATIRGGGGVPAHEGRLLTVREVCEAMRLSRTSVYRLVSSGLLPGVRDASLGRGVRVPEDAVDAYLRQVLPSGVG